MSCNKPFKESIGESYDNWMLNGEKTFTKSGNIRAASKTELCGWVLKAWKNIGVDLVKKSFIACAQVKDAKLEDVSCMKPGRPLEGALPLAQELWQLKSEDIDFKNLCKKPEDKLRRRGRRKMRRRRKMLIGV